MMRNAAQKLTSSNVQINEKDVAAVKPEPRCLEPTTSQLLPQPSSNSQDSSAGISCPDDLRTVKQEKVEQEQKKKKNQDKLPVKVRRCAMLRFN